MRILVLGASGLLGRAVLQRLAGEQADVVAAFHRTPLGLEELAGCRGVEGDLRDPRWLRDLLSESRPEIVIHCAAVITSSADIEERTRAIDVNVRANTFLGAIASELAVPRIVNASSVSVHSPAPDLIDENTPPLPLDFYGLTKYLGEEALLRRRGLQVLNLRFCGLFGPHRKSGAVFNFTQAALTAGEIAVPDSPARFQFLSASDAAAAIWAACGFRGEQSRTFHVASRDIVTLPQLAALIAAQTQPRAGVRLELRAVVQMPLLDIRRANDELGWQPAPLADSLRSFVSSG